MTDKTQAAPELEQIEFEALDRSSFLMKGILAAGATYGAFAAGPMLRKAFAQDGGSEEGDIEILNFALTLEYLETAFYTQAVKKVSGLSGETRKLAVTIRDNETAHVQALTAAIKGLKAKPVAAPGVDFGGAFSSEKSFLKLAQTFEDTGVSAYNGAAPALKSKELLAAAGSIVQIEARHAAAIRTLNGQPVTDGGFDKTLAKDDVLKAVKPFLK